MIIGTAGHIDHGKTSLVKCLTGVDADRLPEEKQRGITIDLGFAYIPNDRGQIVGFVDVPGHEKFVHTMVAGATGIDHGLLIVAADDGIMPQTREHLRVLELLGIPKITVAITKADIVDAARLQEVQSELHSFLGQGPYGDASVHQVSSKTGLGLDQLKQELFNLEQISKTKQAPNFRLAIDRVFVVKGMGVAITGAVTAGTVSVGDNLLLSPSMRVVKVRSIHAQNTPAQSASVGERCGIVITGVEYTDVERGNWLLGLGLNIQTQRIDCSISVPQDSERPIKDGEQILLHHGTEHLLTRIILLNAPAVAPGETVFAQCVFDKPLSMCWGDRFVLRDSSARYTLAGGTVLDLDPPTRGRKKPERIEVLTILNKQPGGDVIEGLLSESDYPINLSHWVSAMNIEQQVLLDIAQKQAATKITAEELIFLFGKKAQSTLFERVTQCLAQFHLDEPDEPGLAIERLRRMSSQAYSPSVFKAWIVDQIGAKSISLTGSFVHLPDHKVELTPAEKAIWEKAYPRLLDGKYDPPWVRDIASELAVPEEKVRLILRKVSKTSELVQLVPDLFYPMKTILEITDIFNGIYDKNTKVTVIDFKDALGLGRKRAIQILEALDRVGYSRRLVSVRRAKSEAEKDHRIIRNRELFLSKEF
jgi:selenocysteine-specific elongation factor